MFAPLTNKDRKRSQRWGGTLMSSSKIQARSANRLLCGASIAVLVGLTAPGAALAQAASPAAPSTADSAPASGVAAANPSDIVVTGTRVIRDGYKAPTPVSVIGAADIARNAPANIADYVNQLPTLAATNTPRSNIGFVSSGLTGINALNLRSLGENRTLVLLDGQRVGASTLTGLVDVNQFPEALVKRVDVVTGGASADWGSDAVSGVINFVLDKDFKGIKGEAQGGVTTYGDDRNFKVSLTAGTGFADDRGHILVSGEIAHNDGISSIGKRSWYNGAQIIQNPAYTATNGLPQYITRANVGYLATPGGLITSGPLNGTYFGPGGTPLPYQFGLVSGINNVGGDWRLGDLGLTGDLDPKLSRQNIFARLSYDVTDHVQVYAQGSYARATSNEGVLPYLGFGTTIQPDNAYIPASLAPQLTTPFSVSTLTGDLGLITAQTRRTAWRGVIGANGDFDALGANWKWDVYGQRSITHAFASTREMPIVANFNNAVDAVRNANGTIVCRSTLTNPNNGCVPFDIFGTGVNGQGTLDYILGSSWIDNRLTESVVSGTLRGNPFSTWAGPVSIATGVEYRSEGVSGKNDPLSDSNSYFFGNYHASHGSYNVTEGFFEIVAPLAKDLPFAKSLDFNGAVRETSYSISGYATTWKAGLTYQPTEDITFRVSRSRDIRAPNLSELFQAGLTQTQVFTDPTRGNSSVTAFQIAQGNTKLKPEIADTLGLGVVVQPHFLPGFAASVDYYDIRIKGAIASVDPQTELNQCAAGNTVFCSQITRNAAGIITSISQSPINFAKQKARGLDFEASYRHPLLQGNLGLRILATRYLENYFDNGISAPTDTVGTNGLNLGNKSSLPKWRYLATLEYDRNPVALSVTARGFSAGVQNTTYIQCTSGCPASTADHPTIDTNRLPGAIYFDTNITVQLGHGIETFVSVDNLLNKDPYQAAYGPGLAAAPLSVNPVLYDVLGRNFRFGVRFKM